MTSAIESVLIQGDLSKFSPEDRVRYYARVCESINLNPLTRPFEYIVLNGRLVLYAKRDCTDQLRRRDRVSIHVVSRETLKDIYVVTARATTPDGRVDEEIGAVNTAGLKGDALANAMMKATTKAKRRVTLSICGLGWLDETEVETLPAAEQPPAKQPLVAAPAAALAAPPAAPGQPGLPGPDAGANGGDFGALVRQCHRTLVARERTWAAALKWLEVQLPEGFIEPATEDAAAWNLTDEVVSEEQLKRLLASLALKKEKAK
jgi:hypothetical protein